MSKLKAFMAAATMIVLPLAYTTAQTPAASLAKQHATPATVQTAPAAMESDTIAASPEVVETTQYTQVLIVQDPNWRDEPEGTEENDGDSTQAALNPYENEPAPFHIAMVEKKPSFPGGEQAMYLWLSENMVYPAEATEQGISGRVVVQFIVERDGTITNVQVVRPRHQALNREALRLVESMPRWEPAEINGKPVRVSYILPVTFRLQ